jgi:hypothetical protein
MELVLKRVEKEANYTIGRLSMKLEKPELKCIDGELVTETERYLCDTLEPRQRRLTKEKKVVGATAIPEGHYHVLITKSFRYGRWLPLVLDVPGFNAVRIFPGNYPADTTVTAGLIVGWNRKHGMLVNSRSALQQVMFEMTAALERGEQLWLTVT